MAECLRHLGSVNLSFSYNEDTTKFFHEALSLVGLGNVREAFAATPSQRNTSRNHCPSPVNFLA